MWEDETHMKDSSRTNSGHIGVLTLAHTDILEFLYVRKSIVHKLKIHI